MSKNKPKRKSRGFPPADSPQKSTAAKPLDRLASSDKRPIRWGLIVLFLTISIGGTYLAIWLRPKNSVPRYVYKLVNTLPHDEQAFTQGIVIADGFLWESTGRYGESSIRKIDLKTGEILKNEPVDEEYFGEGLTALRNQLIQLTWKEEKAFVYDHELKQVSEFDYVGQGWGLTTNGNDLIMSDGTNVLKFLDPATFEIKRTQRVFRPGMMPVGQLNELEYAGGKVYANKYMTDLIYEIDPNTGAVTAIIDLSGLWPKRERPVDGILNGIAVNPGNISHPSFYVTGKLCPKLFEIELVLAPNQ